MRFATCICASYACLYITQDGHMHTRTYITGQSANSTQTPSIHQQTCGSCTIYSPSFYIISNSLFPDHDAHSWTRASKHELKHETRPHRVKKKEEEKKKSSISIQTILGFICACVHTMDGYKRNAYYELSIIN